MLSRLFGDLAAVGADLQAPSKQERSLRSLLQTPPKQERSLQPFAQKLRTRFRNIRCRKTLGKPSMKRRMPEDHRVGSVLQADVDHWQEHSGHADSKNCCRCNFIRHKAELQREVPWCTPRPPFMGGCWSLGCDVCAWNASNNPKEKHDGRHGCNFRASAFATHSFIYNGPYNIMKPRIEQHASATGHRAAAKTAVASAITEQWRTRRP